MNNRLIEIRKQIGKFIANFSVTEEDGKEYVFDGDVIREGLAISTYDEKGDIIPLPDGEYTIKGVKVKIADGLVSEIVDKESKVDGKEEVKAETEPVQEPKEEVDETAKQLATALAEIESLKAENEALKKEIEDLKSVPMADPVPQRTNMSSERTKEVPDNVKGTKYEKAFNIFNN